MGEISNGEIIKFTPTETKTLPYDCDIISIDCGSTNTKMEHNKYTVKNGLEKNPDTDEKTESEKPEDEKKEDWPTLKYSEGVYTENGQDVKYKFLAPDNLEKLLDSVDAKIADIKRNDKFPPLLAVTGFTNSLAVRYTDQTGKSKTMVLLDDPSLSCNPTKEQKEKYNKHFGTSDVKVSSTTMKMLTLFNHRDLVKKLFGDNIQFSDLKFGTMIGAITEKLTANPNDFGMPLADIRGLGNNGLQTSEKAYQIMADILYGEINDGNISKVKKQLTIHEKPYISSTKATVMEVNDFEGETLLLENKIKEDAAIPEKGDYALKEDSIILAMDTVGKILWARDRTSDYKRNINDFSYDTQRVTALVNPKWNKLAYKTEKGDPDFFKINQVLDNAVKNNLTTDYIFYPEMSDGENIGMLFKKGPDDQIPVRIDRNNIPGMDETEKQKVVLAVAQGVMFGLRQNLENRWSPDELQHRQIISYGGLGSHNQDGWNQLYADIFYDLSDHVGRLDLPSGNLAAAYAAVKKFGWGVKVPDISIRYFNGDDFDKILSQSRNQKRLEQYSNWTHIQIHLNNSQAN